jgi:hypothetical protein
MNGGGVRDFGLFAAKTAVVPRFAISATHSHVLNISISGL